MGGVGGRCLGVHHSESAAFTESADFKGARSGERQGGRGVAPWALGEKPCCGARLGGWARGLCAGEVASEAGNDVTSVKRVRGHWGHTCRFRCWGLPRGPGGAARGGDVEVGERWVWTDVRRPELGDCGIPSACWVGRRGWRGWAGRVGRGPTPGMPGGPGSTAPVCRAHDTGARACGQGRRGSGVGFQRHSPRLSGVLDGPRSALVGGGRSGGGRSRRSVGLGVSGGCAGNVLAPWGGRGLGRSRRV
jgi:hypothetical protein